MVKLIYGTRCFDWRIVCEGDGPYGVNVKKWRENKHCINARPLTWNYPESLWGHGCGSSSGRVLFGGITKCLPPLCMEPDPKAPSTLELKLRAEDRSPLIGGEPLTHASSQKSTSLMSSQFGSLNFLLCLQHLDGSRLEPLWQALGQNVKLLPWGGLGMLRGWALNLWAFSQWASNQAFLSFSVKGV